MADGIEKGLHHDTHAIGRARPEDLDEVFLAATKSADADYRARVEAVESSVTAHRWTLSLGS